jgi:hypothetical protein
MPNPFEKLKKRFSIVMNLRPGYIAQVDEPEEQDVMPPQGELAVAMQEEGPVAEVASPEKITELLNLVYISNKKYLSNGGFEAEIEARAGASATLAKVSEGLHQLVQLNVIAEVTFELKAAYATEYVKFSASLKAFATASLDFNVDFMNIKKGVIIDANFDFNAKVAAIATASAEVRIFNIGELGVTVGASAEAYAIAETSVSGRFKIGMEGIAIEGNVKVGATVGVAIEGSASLDIKGKKLISLSNKLEASVGLGSEIGGTFSFENGKLKIKIDFGLTFGAGGTVHEDLTVDFDAIKECIKEELEILANKLKEKINAYLIVELDKIIAELKAAGDDTETLLSGNIDSETGILHETSTWTNLKNIVKAKPGIRKQKALLAVIEIGISLTGGKGVSGSGIEEPDGEFPEQEGH